MKNVRIPIRIPFIKIDDDEVEFDIYSKTLHDIKHENKKMLAILNDNIIKVDSDNIDKYDILDVTNVIILREKQ